MSSFHLPRFRKALAGFSKELPSGTFWRYSNGMLPPPLGELLVKNPELAQALAADAVELAKKGDEGAMKGGEASINQVV
jgi:hypothetical protein